jgi:transposase
MTETAGGGPDIREEEQRTSRAGAGSFGASRGSCPVAGASGNRDVVGRMARRGSPRASMTVAASRGGIRRPQPVETKRGGVRRAGLVPSASTPPHQY